MVTVLSFIKFIKMISFSGSMLLYFDYTTAADK